MEMKKKNSGLGYCILGVAGKLLEALKFFFFFFLCKAEIGMATAKFQHWSTT